MYFQDTPYITPGQAATKVFAEPSARDNWRFSTFREQQKNRKHQTNSAQVSRISVQNYSLTLLRNVSSQGIQSDPKLHTTIKFMNEAVAEHCVHFRPRKLNFREVEIVPFSEKQTDYDVNSPLIFAYFYIFLLYPLRKKNMARSDITTST